MILIKIKHQDGEREYTSYHYKTSLTEKQYNHAAQLDFNPNSLEEKIMKEIYDGWSLEWDEEHEAWWRDTSLVWIEDVRDLSRTRFETLVELGILYR